MFSGRAKDNLCLCRRPLDSERVSSYLAPHLTKEPPIIDVNAALANQLNCSLVSLSAPLSPETETGTATATE